MPFWLHRCSSSSLSHKIRPVSAPGTQVATEATPAAAEPHHTLDYPPIVFQPVSAPQPPGSPVTGVYGLGDINPSFFLSPKKSKVIWGVGPTFVFPTATNTTYLGQGKLSIGPTVVALIQPPHFTIGVLANNYWSVAGHSDRDKPAVNQFPIPVVRQLQHEEGLVPENRTHRCRQLESGQQ